MLPLEKLVPKKRLTMKAYDGDVIAACKLTDETITDILKEGVYRRRSRRLTSDNAREKHMRSASDESEEDEMDI